MNGVEFCDFSCHRLESVSTTYDAGCFGKCQMLLSFFYIYKELWIFSYTPSLVSFFVEVHLKVLLFVMFSRSLFKFIMECC